MARMIPDATRNRVVFASRAEARFYDLCREQLGSNWRVYYSRTLSEVDSKEGMRDHEMDFVLYHPRYGIIIIEVKGGRIRYESASNNFFSVDRMGREFSIKNPFQQAVAWKGRLVRFLKARGMRAPVSHAVCFPSANESEFPKLAGLEPEVILGRNRLIDLEKSLREIVQMSHPAKFLRFDDISLQLDEVLAGSDFCTRHYFRDYIDAHELKVADMEQVQDTLVNPVAASHRLGVEGEAGTGKTVLALNMAKHFRDLGKSVLLLSSNGLLNSYLQDRAGAGIDVKTYTEIAEGFGINFLKPDASYRGSREDWIQFEAPDRLVKAVANGKLRYQVILCDEAQDVQPFWWDVIESLLDAKDSENRLFIFFDRSQGVFGSGGDQSFVPEEVLPVAAPYFNLVNNYRTTREIAAFARLFRTGRQVLESHSSRLGYLPQIITYDDEGDARRKLDRLVGKLTHEEGLLPSDITLLSARKPLVEPSIIAGQDKIGDLPIQILSGIKRTGPISPSQESIPISTISSFKGLETNVGILLNISEYNMPLSNPIMASLIYVACTRAKHMLYIFVKSSDPKRAVFEQNLKRVNFSGAVIIDNEISDYELRGKIIHYNAQRVGWIEVDDPHFDQGTIMFFPTDVTREELRFVKVGQTVRFRTRREGPAFIAIDLHLVKNKAPIARPI